MVKAKVYRQNHPKKHTCTHSQKEKKEKKKKKIYINIYIYIYIYILTTGRSWEKKE